MTTGKRIKKARLKKGYTQDELAEILGYKSRSSINKIEKDERDIPRSVLLQFAYALDVSPSYLMCWDEASPAEQEQEFIEMFSKLTAKQKKAIIMQMELLSEEE